ncbi:MAG: ABC transporter ATP-binding protein [Chloroflexota bacterium]
MIRLESASYRYAGARSPSLEGIDLALDDGEVVGLMGPSEAGKTTLCLVVAGLAPRSIRGTLGGRVLLDGADLAGEPIHALAGRVAVAFQDPVANLSGVAETVYEEVAFGPANLGVPREELLDRVDEALTRLRIEALAGRDPRTLSGGQQQLVAIAGALALRPRHLVLDEPAAQLDPAGTRLVMDAVAALAAGGTSILLAEHRTDALARACDRVVVLDAGRVVRDGPAADVLADPGLPALGLDERSDVRLARLATEAGLDAGRLLPPDLLADPRADLQAGGR